VGSSSHELHRFRHRCNRGRLGCSVRHKEISANGRSEFLKQADLHPARWLAAERLWPSNRLVSFGKHRQAGRASQRACRGGPEDLPQSLRAIVIQRARRRCRMRKWLVCSQAPTTVTCATADSAVICAVGTGHLRPVAGSNAHQECAAHPASQPAGSCVIGEQQACSGGCTCLCFVFPLLHQPSNNSNRS
jgi:hypothetical protein